METTLPQAFLNKMKEILSAEDYQKYLDSLALPVQKAIRINTQKISVKEFEKLADFHLEQIPYSQNGFYIQNEQKLGEQPLHYAGAYYIQEPSSMIPVLSVAHLDWNGKKALDLCAAPGGKTGQLAELVGESGVILSNEIVYSRNKILQENIERLGYRNVILTCETADRLAKKYERAFDLVLVDAPCSGEGMFRKDEAASQLWTEQGVVSNAKRQLELLKSGAKCVADAGYLIYSTCTFSPIEDEEVVLQLLQDGGFEPVELNPIVKPFLIEGLQGLKTAGRFYPFNAKGEGQFVAVLQKKQSDESEVKQFVKELSSSFTQKFLHDIMEKPESFKLEQIGNYVNIIPNNVLNTREINVMTKGVRLGEEVKGRMEPAHQFFTAFGNKMKQQLSLKLSDARVEKYLHGEEITDERFASGYGAVLIEGCAVGGFKAVNGVLKNRLPKVLRK